jgi:hypothetical protein
MLAVTATNSDNGSVSARPGERGFGQLRDTLKTHMTTTPVRFRVVSLCASAEPS